MRSAEAVFFHTSFESCNFLHTSDLLQPSVFDTFMLHDANSTKYCTVLIVISCPLFASFAHSTSCMTRTS